MESFKPKAPPSNNTTPDQARPDEADEGVYDGDHVDHDADVANDDCDNYVGGSSGPVGLMDKASASGAGDSRFESWAGHAY